MEMRVLRDKMDPERWELSLQFSFPYNIPQLIWTFKLRQRQSGCTQLKGGVRVRSCGTGKAVQAREFCCAMITTGDHTTSIKYLYCIHPRGNLQQVLQIPCPASPMIKRMRDADERTLVTKTLDRFLRRESRRDFFGHIGGQDFAARGHNLLANDNQLGVKLVRSWLPEDSVVVSDNQPIQSAVAAYSD